MDGNKIGTFITERRKAKNLTQKNIAEKLCVTDRAVSKWECGKGLPDVSLMKPLCELLGITINELLSGEMIEAQDTAAKAEKQIMDLLRERQENRIKRWISAILAIIGVFALLVSMILSAYVLTDLLARILIVVFGAIILTFCTVAALLIDINAGSFECPKCKKAFVPDMKTYIFSLNNIFRQRKFKCPHCGERSWCKRKLNNN